MPEDEKHVEGAIDPKENPDPAIPEAEIIEDKVVQNAPEDPIMIAQPTPPQRRRSGFFGTVIGGVLAATAGFGLARAIPGGWPIQDNAALEAQIAAQSDQLEKLKSDLADLASRPESDPSAELATLRAGLEERLAESAAAADPSPAIAKATDALQASIVALDARLTEVEKRPAGGGGGVSATALAAYDRELQSLRDQIAGFGGGADAKAQIEGVAAEAKAQLAAAAQEADQLRTEMATSSRQARIDAAVGRIAAALEGGGPYVSAISELDEAGLSVPPELAGPAESGVPTMMELQRRFPDAARAALDSALRTQVGESWGDRVAAFLRTQTGARSLEPREGNDPDAVLSRAEAAVNNGDLPVALTELVALPEPAQAPLADWLADANARIAAVSAVTALAAAADAQ